MDTVTGRVGVFLKGDITFVVSEGDIVKPSPIQHVNHAPEANTGEHRGYTRMIIRWTSRDPGSTIGRVQRSLPARSSQWYHLRQVNGMLQTQSSRGADCQFRKRRWS